MSSFFFHLLLYLSTIPFIYLFFFIFFFILLLRFRPLYTFDWILPCLYLFLYLNYLHSHFMRWRESYYVQNLWYLRTKSSLVFFCHFFPFLFHFHILRFCIPIFATISHILISFLFYFLPPSPTCFPPKGLWAPFRRDWFSGLCGCLSVCLF